jgi:hypothetical protein
LSDGQRPCITSPSWNKVITGVRGETICQAKQRDSKQMFSPESNWAHSLSQDNERLLNRSIEIIFVQKFKKCFIILR